MESSELLRLQLAKKLECSRIGYASGPTGPTGPNGPTGMTGSPKTFTLYIDFSSSLALSRLYIPPGFCTAWPNGNIFTNNDVVNNILFLGSTNITISNTTYAFPVALNVTGFSASTIPYWSPSQAASIGGGNLTWQNTTDYNLNLKGVTATRVCGGNVSVRPTTGVLSGWLGTITITYL